MERAVDRQARQWHAQGLIEDRCAIRRALRNPLRWICAPSSPPRSPTVGAHPGQPGDLRGVGNIRNSSVCCAGSSARALRLGDLERPAARAAAVDPDRRLASGRPLHADYDPLADRLRGLAAPGSRRRTSGWLQVIPGAHRNGLRPAFFAWSVNSLVGLADRELTGQQPVSCSMTPGDVYRAALPPFQGESLPPYPLESRRALFRCHQRGVADQGEPADRGTGYYCYSGADPRRVTPFAAWAAAYDYDGAEPGGGGSRRLPGQPYPSALQPVGCFGPLGEVLPTYPAVGADNPMLLGEVDYGARPAPGASSYSARARRHDGRP